MLIGVITKVYNQKSALFTWYKPGNIIVAGIDPWLLHIKEPGDYIVTV